MSTLTFSITAEDIAAKGTRADQVLCGFENLPSRSQLKAWFLAGRIRRGEQILSPSDRLAVGDRLDVHPLPVAKHNLEPRAHPLAIHYEDEDLIVLYKPRGLSMHPGASKSSETTLVHALLAHAQTLSNRGGDFRAGIVHRLDKDTEGLVVVAKDNEVHESLASQFSARTIDRNYWALCYGHPPKNMVIDSPLGRHPVQRKKMAVVRNGKEAKTEVRCLSHFAEGYSWIDCKLHSGRTHQIRVHLTSKKFSLLNDPVYGRKRNLVLSEAKRKALENLKGQALVAYRLGFEHPRLRKRLLFECPKPDWLEALTAHE